MNGKSLRLKLAVLAAMVVMVSLPAEANRLRKLVSLQETKKGETKCEGTTEKCGKRCITYRHHRRHKKICKECCRRRCRKDCKEKCKPTPPPIKAVLTVVDPCCCCKIEVPVCIPACCKKAPTKKCSKGLFGSVTTFKWCCGYKVRVIVKKKCGSVVVHSYGK